MSKLSTFCPQFDIISTSFWSRFRHVLATRRRWTTVVYGVGKGHVIDVMVEFDQPGHRLGKRLPLKLDLLEVLVDLVVEFD